MARAPLTEEAITEAFEAVRQARKATKNARKLTYKVFGRVTGGDYLKLLAALKHLDAAIAVMEGSK